MSPASFFEYNVKYLINKHKGFISFYYWNVCCIHFYFFCNNITTIMFSIGGKTLLKRMLLYQAPPVLFIHIDRLKLVCIWKQISWILVRWTQLVIDYIDPLHVSMRDLSRALFTVSWNFDFCFDCQPKDSPRLSD